MNPYLHKIIILSTSLVATENTVVAILLADIAKTFPEASMTAIQLVMTLGMIGCFPAIVLTGILVDKITKKSMLLIGITLIFIGGIIPITLPTYLNLLYVSSFIVGAGQGFIIPTIIALIIERFQNKERHQMFGFNQSVANGGAMLLLVLGGIIMAKTVWINVYYLYLLALPIFLGVLFFLPKKVFSIERMQHIENKNNITNKSTVPFSVLIVCVLAFLYYIGFVTFALNVSIFLDQNVIGDQSTAAFAMSIMTAFAILAGIIFARLVKWLNHFVLTLAAIFALLGLGLMYISGSIQTVYLASAFIGLSYGTQGAGGAYCISCIVTDPIQVSKSMSILMSMVIASVIASPFLINGVTFLILNTEQSRDVFLISTLFMSFVLALLVLWSLLQAHHFKKT